jgi:geranylgeranyl diphosphate synthase, type I
MPHPFIRYKKIIDSYLTKFLSIKQKKLSSVNKWSDDVFNKLRSFVVSGKTIRGSLVLLISEAFGKKVSTDSLNISAALELSQAGFLIHDDIIDQDRLRRGLPSTYAYFEEVGKQLYIDKYKLFGQNAAICAGDLSFFLSFECLGNINSDTQYSHLLKTFSHEYQYVCLAQMQDVEYGLSNRIPSYNEVMSLYRYKTARYSFSLPFAAGSILADIPANGRLRFEKLGEQMGLLFQLHDDELNLFGNPKESGKPVGSDIREGKKTLGLIYLFTHAGNDDRHKLQMIMNHKTRTPADVSFVYGLFEKYQIRMFLKTEMNRLSHAARCQLELLSLPSPFNEHLMDLIEYVQNRPK